MAKLSVVSAARNRDITLALSPRGRLDATPSPTAFSTGHQSTTQYSHGCEIWGIGIRFKFCMLMLGESRKHNLVESILVSDRRVQHKTKTQRQQSWKGNLLAERVRTTDFPNNSAAKNGEVNSSRQMQTNIFAGFFLGKLRS